MGFRLAVRLSRCTGYSTKEIIIYQALPKSIFIPMDFIQKCSISTFFNQNKNNNLHLITQKKIECNIKKLKDFKQKKMKIY